MLAEVLFTSTLASLLVGLFAITDEASDMALSAALLMSLLLVGVIVADALLNLTMAAVVNMARIIMIVLVIATVAALLLNIMPNNHYLMYFKQIRGFAEYQRLINDAFLHGRDFILQRKGYSAAKPSSQQPPPPSQPSSRLWG